MFLLQCALIVHWVKLNPSLIHFPAQIQITHPSSTAFRQHSLRIQKKLLFCFQPFPQSWPLSFFHSPPAHRNNAVKFFCIPLSPGRKKGGRGCVSVHRVWLIIPVLCSIYRIVDITPVLKKKVHTVYGSNYVSVKTTTSLCCSFASLILRQPLS